MRRPCAFTVFVAVAAVVACHDSPTAGAPAGTIPRAAFVPGEYWQATDLGTLDSGATAEAINDAGLIVGSGRVWDGSFVAFQSTGGGPLQVLPVPAVGTEMTAHDVNEAGAMTGAVRVSGVWRAYFRPSAGRFQVLPQYGKGATANFGEAINDHGDVVGITDGTVRAVRWTSSLLGWTATNIGDLGGDTFAHDINNDGWVVGTAWVAHNQYMAYIKKPGQAMQSLGSLGGRGGRSSGNSVNASGMVLGTTTTVGNGGPPRYFTWTTAGGLVNQASTTHRGRRGAISDKGRIVGTDSIGGDIRAFTQYQGIYNVLPMLIGGKNSFAYDVNGCGVIVGAVYMNSGETHAVRWRRVVGTPPLGICD